MGFNAPFLRYNPDLTDFYTRPIRRQSTLHAKPALRSKINEKATLILKPVPNPQEPATNVLLQQIAELEGLLDTLKSKTQI